MRTQSLGGPPAVDQDSFFALADVRQPAGQRRIGWARLKRNCISYCEHRGLVLRRTSPYPIKRVVSLLWSLIDVLSAN